MALGLLLGLVWLWLGFGWIRLDFKLISAGCGLALAGFGWISAYYGLFLFIVAWLESHICMHNCIRNLKIK